MQKSLDFAFSRCCRTKPRWGHFENNANVKINFHIQDPLKLLREMDIIRSFCAHFRIARKREGEKGKTRLGVCIILNMSKLYKLQAPIKKITTDSFPQRRPCAGIFSGSVRVF